MGAHRTGRARRSGSRTPRPHRGGQRARRQQRTLRVRKRRSGCTGCSASAGCRGRTGCSVLSCICRWKRRLCTRALGPQLTRQPRVAHHLASRHLRGGSAAKLACCYTPLSRRVARFVLCAVPANERGVSLPKNRSQPAYWAAAPRGGSSSCAAAALRDMHVCMYM